MRENSAISAEGITREASAERSVSTEWCRLRDDLFLTSALLEILTKIQNARDLKHACHTLAAELRALLGAERIAVALCQRSNDDVPRKRPCRLYAVTHLSRFDKQSELVGAIEAALNEAILRDAITVWPPQPDAERGADLAHRKLCSTAGAEAVVSSPLRDDEGRLIGAWLFLVSKEFVAQPARWACLRAFERPIASCLRLVAEADPGFVTRHVRQLLKSRKTWKARLAAVVTVSLLGALLLPWSHKIRCDVQLQPVARRFVVAPFDGMLEKTLVEPGDLVSAGDVLARMDGRELRWELAGLEAEHNRAEKRRDAALAIHNVAATQQAALEIQRLKLKIRLLHDRTEHLEIKSPRDGIVISGDLKKVDGAPLTVGQALFEIAPLDRMIVEIAIPEEEIAHTDEGMEVILRVDAYPARQWHGTIAKIFPRSEIRDGQSVFLAEAHLDNASGLLRPGMHGRAKIIGPRRTLGWSLFHKPYESLALLIGW
jgi:multidrug resistance efflux pump